MQKLWKAAATIAVLVLLFWMPFTRVLPDYVFVPLLFMALTHGISLFLSARLPVARRLAIAYLVFVGFTYLFAGAEGFDLHGGLIEGWAWAGLISPYLLFSFFSQMSQHYPYPASKTAFYVLPEGPHLVFSTTAVIVGFVAILAAFAMARPYRAAYLIWGLLLGLSIVSLVGYVIVAIASPGEAGMAVQLCWEVTYILAFVMALRGADAVWPVKKIGWRALRDGL